MIQLRQELNNEKRLREDSEAKNHDLLQQIKQQCANIQQLE